MGRSACVRVRRGLNCKALALLWRRGLCESGRILMEDGDEVDINGESMECLWCLNLLGYILLDGWGKRVCLAQLQQTPKQLGWNKKQCVQEGEAKIVAFGPHV